MNKLMAMEKLVHPEEDHLLRFVEGSESVPLSQTCHKCMQPAVSRDYYQCIRLRCGYYLHKECFELKDLPQKHHPLHPQHPLAEHLNYPCEKSFVCSFCGENKQSREFCQCTDDQCDFYLDTTCQFDFIKRPELLDKYEIQHVLHHHENHRLSPYTYQSDDEGNEICDSMSNPDIIDYEFDDEGNEICDSMFNLGYSDMFNNPDYNARCAGCTNFNPDYKCIACPFYLHTQCSQVPTEVVQHPSHPQHPLVLLHHDSDDELHCSACLNWIKGAFYLHCNHCPTFNLDLHCYFRFKPTFKHKAHDHLLAFFPRIYDAHDNVSCYACNTPCYCNSFRCFSCNFNIHSGCHALPITVDYYDHVHPLTLTTSFKEDSYNSCYICEEGRDPDHGIYLCKESEGCSFVAHFECALSLNTEEKEKYADEPWRQKLKDDDQEDTTLTNKSLRQDILDQLNEEIQKVNDLIKQLTIKERGGEQLTKKLQELDERHANTEDILRRLKQSFRGTNNN